MKLQLTPVFPGIVAAGPGINVSTANGVFTFGLAPPLYYANQVAGVYTRVGFNTSAPDGDVDLWSTASGATRGLYLTQISDDANSQRLNIRKARGTPTVLTAIKANDAIFNIGGWGRDDAGWSSGSRVGINGGAAADWNFASHPTFMTLSTTPNASITRTDRVKLHPTGNLVVGTILNDIGDLLTLTLNAVALPVAPSGTILHLGGVDGQTARFTSDAFAGASSLVLRRSNTSAAAPSPLAQDDVIGSLQAFGMGTTVMSPTPRASFQLAASEPWTDAANGTYIDVKITPNGTTVIANAARWQNSGGLSIGTVTDPGIGALLANTSIKSQSPTAGIGYAAGAGSTVTQGTDKSTGVTINAVSGKITMNNAALLNATVVSFLVTNSTVAATDTVVVNIASGGTVGSYQVGVTAVGAGTFNVSLRNQSAGSLSEAVVLNFTVIKGVSA